MNIALAAAAFKEELSRENEAVCLCCNRRARINKLRIHSTLALILAAAGQLHLAWGADDCGRRRSRAP